EIGNIFKLGTRYTEAMGCTFQDRDGKNKPVVMGSYGIGVGRLLACVAEEHNDDNGLIWPIAIAPYHVHLVNLCKNASTADKVYEDLKKEGIEVLYDDRKESAGVKFKDADLIGLPLRVLIGDRLIKNNNAEIKRRTADKPELISLDDVITKVKAEKKALEDEIAAGVVEVPFKD
ncbi:MAG: proline--tRNA ligase, partial [bacterium]|nr:proline--tRNA ligase [bacterium]